MSKPYIQPDFSGGMRDGEHAVFAENQCQDMNNFWWEHGMLKTMQGDVPWCTKPILSTCQGVDTTGIQSICKLNFLGNNGLVVKCGGSFWVGLHSHLKLATTQHVDYVKIDYAATALTYVPMSGGYFQYRGIMYQFVSKDEANGRLNMAAGTNPVNAHATSDAGEYIDIVDWRPIYADAISEAGIYYLQGGQTTYPERGKMISTDAWLYFSINDLDSKDCTSASNIKAYRPMRWTNGFVASGYASCPGTTTVTFSVNVGTLGISQGDILFIRNHVDNTWPTDGAGTWGRVIKVVGGTTVTLWSNGPDTTGKGDSSGNNCDYIIVKVGPMGIPAMGQVTTQAIANGSLAANNYDYRLQFRSDTGLNGNLGTFVTNTTSGGNLTIRLTYPLPAWGSDKDYLNLFYVRVLRKETATSVWKFLKDAAISWVNNYVDDDGSVSLGASYTEAELLSEAQKDPPGNATPLALCNGRLWMRQQGTSRQNLIMSTYGAVESFPKVALGSVNATTGTSGGLIPIGTDQMDPVIAIVPEIGASTNTATAAGSLLIFTTAKVTRLFGFDWTNFQIRDTFAVNCIADDSIVNRDGVIYFLTKQGLMRLSVGSDMPQACSKSMWPKGLANRIEQLRDSSQMQVLPWSAAYWQGNYFLTGMTETSTAFDRVFVYNVQTDSWGQIKEPWACVLAARSGQVFAGSAQYATIGKLFVGVPAYNSDVNPYPDQGTYTKAIVPTAGGVVAVANKAIEYLSRPLYLGSGDKAKKLLGVSVCIRCPKEAQNISATLYADGDTSTALAGPTALTTDTTTTYKRDYMHWDLQGSRAMFFQLKLTGSITREMAIESVEFEFEGSEPVRKR